jgi:hypothetical protein
MSRLDAAIRRLQNQRLCLDWAVNEIAPLPGMIFEFGLGYGRTFDHLRERCPGRAIHVFDRALATHPDCVPDPSQLHLGEIGETLPAAAVTAAQSVALVHADIGGFDADETAALAQFIAGFLPGLLASGGLVVSDQPMRFEGAEDVAAPEDVAPGRYFIYRRS